MPKSTGTAQSLRCGVLSKKTVKILIGTLTTDEIRRFARLDDVKILKENDNFNRMRDEPTCKVGRQSDPKVDGREAGCGVRRIFAS